MIRAQIQVQASLHTYSGLTLLGVHFWWQKWELKPGDAYLASRVNESDVKARSCQICNWNLYAVRKLHAWWHIQKNIKIWTTRRLVSSWFRQHLQTQVSFGCGNVCKSGRVRARDISRLVRFFYTNKPGPRQILQQATMHADGVVYVFS